ncbi:unknown [Clostridium sp. CAG:813]|nr:unknown [Clostridium sp. CAG:813]
MPGAKEINTAVEINPQNIIALFRILSAKKPKYGCNKDEKI